MSPQFSFDSAFLNRIEMGTCTSFDVGCFIGVQLPKFKQSFKKNHFANTMDPIFTNVVIWASQSCAKLQISHVWESNIRQN